MIYLIKDGQQVGPYDAHVLEQMLQSGSVTASDLAWKEGLEDWEPLSVMLEARTRGAAPPPLPKAKDVSSSLWFKLTFLAAILMIVLPFAPKLLKTASNVTAAFVPSAPEEMLDSKLHMAMDGNIFEATTNTLRDVISGLEARGCRLSWADGGAGSWICSIFRHDPLMDTDQEVRLELVCHEQQTIVRRGTVNGRVLNENDLSVIIVALSGDLERGLSKQQ